MNYTCLPNAGPNPDFGYTNFDHMGWSLVMSFQLLTMDFWENIYDKVGTVKVVDAIYICTTLLFFQMDAKTIHTKTKFPEFVSSYLI